MLFGLIMWPILKSVFRINTAPDMKKFLIVGLGNIGEEYAGTRHNIGFKILNHLAEIKDLSFETVKLADKSTYRLKGKQFVLIKPTTFMNRSGKAVRYWALKENIPLENILILTDELHLPFGTLRLRGKGSDGGHNGLKDIEAHLNTPNYARLRFGVGQGIKPMNQVQFVLGKWNKDEENTLNERLTICVELVLSFGLIGLQKTMNQFNGK